MTFDKLGDRLKAVEQLEAARKADRTKPLMARLDGKAFHTFTKGLLRPYDSRLSQLMIETTKELVEKTHAILGYTQSDEITLFWVNDLEKNEGAQFLHDGKFQKMTSVLAAIATAKFNRRMLEILPEKSDSYPIFDCRVWNVDNLDDVIDNYIWRQQDAVKNSISMAAQAHFSHKQLQGVGSEAKKSMLREIGHPWEDMPEFFKMGTFVKRQSSLVDLTSEQLAKIPEKHRPTGPVERTAISDAEIGYLENLDEEERKKYFV